MMESGKSSHSLSPNAGRIAQEQAVTLLVSQSPSQSPQQQKSSLGFHCERATSITVSFAATSSVHLIPVAQIITHLYPRQLSSLSLPPGSRAKLPGFVLSNSYCFIHPFLEGSQWLPTFPWSEEGEKGMTLVTSCRLYPLQPSHAHSAD